MSKEISLYNSAKVSIYEMKDASLAVRKFGVGKPLVFIHGFIVHGYTWRKLLPTLAQNHSCYVIDLPGFGDSRWSNKTEFTFTAQAKRLALLFQKLKLNNYDIIAHDTGASIARVVALIQPKLARKMTQQFKKKGVLIPISNAALMPHEEQPASVLNAIIPFLETK